MKASVRGEGGTDRRLVRRRVTDRGKEACEDVRNAEFVPFATRSLVYVEVSKRGARIDKRLSGQERLGESQ